MESWWQASGCNWIMGQLGDQVLELMGVCLHSVSEFPNSLLIIFIFHFDYMENASLSIRDLLLGTGDAFYIEKLLPSGIYQFRFIVDGYLRCAPDLPWFSDSSGNAYNILDLQVIHDF